jgi:hypothetical protein
LKGFNGVVQTTPLHSFAGVKLYAWVNLTPNGRLCRTWATPKIKKHHLLERYSTRLNQTGALDSRFASIILPILVSLRSDDAPVKSEAKIPQTIR